MTEKIPATLQHPPTEVPRIEIVSGVKVGGWWPNIRIGEPGWWWVYLFEKYDEYEYVGRTKNLQRRMAEHRRAGLLDDCLAIAVDNEDASIRLEEGLVRALRPARNTLPDLPWDSRLYWDRFRGDYFANDHIAGLQVCSGCCALVTPIWMFDGRIMVAVGRRRVGCDSCLEGPKEMYGTRSTAAHLCSVLFPPSPPRTRSPLLDGFIPPGEWVRR